MNYINNGIQKALPLLLILLKRDIIGKYRRATLGSLYAIIQPVGYMVTFVLLGKIIGVNSEGIPQIIMLLTGLVPWLFFQNSVSSCSTIIIGNAELLKKMPVSKVIFPILAILVGITDFIVSSIVLIMFSIYYQIPLKISLLWLPLLVLILIFFTFALGLLVSAIGTIRTDIQFILPFALNLWMFGSPVIYSLSQIPEDLKSMYLLNPMTGIVDSFRQVIAYGVAPNMSSLSLSVIESLIVFIIAWPIFRYYSKYFSDVI